MESFKLLQTLSETPGPSGNEQAIANAVETLWQPYASRFVRDHVGNLMAIKEGSGPTPRRSILLAAHMDEIALMVYQIVGHNGSGFCASPT
jgi:putative aminopeptidase FrvX